MESSILLANANALHIPLADQSVQCVITSPPYFGLRSYLKTGDALKNKEIGFNQTVDEYVATMTQAFREIWRVLKDDGVAWLNISDSYNGSGGAGGDYNVGGIKEGQPTYGRRNVDGIRPKSLILIPARVSLALQADGWIIRNDNIWAKACSGNYMGGSTMPESAKDRFTRAHEHVFLLTKKPNYYFDHEAALEPALYDGRLDTVYKGDQKYKLNTEQETPRAGGERWPQKIRGFKTKEQIPDMQHHGQDIGYSEIDGMPARNRRDVWVISTSSYPGAHYAVFPQALIEPCVLTASAPNDVVLDPFVGSGTTCAVARKHGRRAVGLDLNFDYLNVNARERLAYGDFVHVGDGVKQLTLK